jgi:hypothetical protein
VVYLPYLDGTADERQYQVMSHREQWFRVVIGQEEVARLITADSAGAIALPVAISNELSLKLDLTRVDQGLGLGLPLGRPRNGRRAFDFGFVLRDLAELGLQHSQQRRGELGHVDQRVIGRGVGVEFLGAVEDGLRRVESSSTRTAAPSTSSPLPDGSLQRRGGQ